MKRGGSWLWSASFAVVLGLGACSNAESGTTADAPFAEWTIAEDLRIDPASADLTSGGIMIVARNGDILLTQTQDNNIRVFGHDGSMTTIGRAGGGPGEFRRIIRAGLIGDTVWALDPVLGRISYFGPDYRFLRAVKDPGTGMDIGPENPVHMLSIQAVLPDGMLRAIAHPYSGGSPPAWLADLGPDEGAIVRVNMAGEHLGRLAVDKPDPCMVRWTTDNGGSGGHVLPFCGRPIATDWDATTNLGLLEVERSDGDSASYRVVVIDYRGDTTLARSFPYTPIPVSQFKLDSASAVQAERDATNNPAFVSSRPPLTPGTTLPPIRAMVLGRDGTVWLEEEEELPTHQWRVLSAAGEPIGQVTLPAHVRLRAAERGMLWATITDEDDLVGIARYRILQ